MPSVAPLPLSSASSPGAAPSQSFPQASLPVKVAVPSLVFTLHVPLGNHIIPMAPAATSMLTTPDPVGCWAGMDQLLRIIIQVSGILWTTCKSHYVKNKYKHSKYHFLIIWPPGEPRFKDFLVYHGPNLYLKPAWSDCLSSRLRYPTICWTPPPACLPGTAHSACPEQAHHHPTHTRCSSPSMPIALCCSSIHPNVQARNLGIILDSPLSLFPSTW